MLKKENDFLAGKCIYEYKLRAPGISKICIHEALLRNAFSLRSKRFRAV